MFFVKQNYNPETMEVKLELSLVNEDKSFTESYKAGFSNDVKLVDGKFVITLKPHGKK